MQTCVFFRSLRNYRFAQSKIKRKLKSGNYADRAATTDHFLIGRKKRKKRQTNNNIRRRYIFTSVNICYINTKEEKTVFFLSRIRDVDPALGHTHVSCPNYFNIRYYCCYCSRAMNSNTANTQSNTQTGDINV